MLSYPLPEGHREAIPAHKTAIEVSLWLVVIGLHPHEVAYKAVAVGVLDVIEVRCMQVLGTAAAKKPGYSTIRRQVMKPPLERPPT